MAFRDLISSYLVGLAKHHLLWLSPVLASGMDRVPVNASRDHDPLWRLVEWNIPSKVVSFPSSRSFCAAVLSSGSTIFSISHKYRHFSKTARLVQYTGKSRVLI